MELVGRYVSKPLIDENGNISILTIDRADETLYRWTSSYPWPDDRIAEVIENGVDLAIRLKEERAG